jgi:hypothetical protein
VNRPEHVGLSGQKAAAPGVRFESFFFCHRIVPSLSLSPIGPMPLMGLII